MLHQQIAQNKRKTIIVLMLYSILFALIGMGIGYSIFRNPITGLLIALIGGGLYAYITITLSTNIVMRLNHATEITNKDQYPMLYNIVEEMSIIAKVPMPKIFIIEDNSPNAFATGMKPEKAAVAVTRGLLDTLNREELEGVIAHEFGHIKNYDVRLQTIVVALGAVIALLVQFSRYSMRFGSYSRRRSQNDNDNNSNISDIILMLLSFLAIIFGPIMATIIQLALSRNREYLADATAVEFTRNPHGLISALQKISNAPSMKQADPQSAALYISNPLKNKDEKDSLFSTHPSTSNRIKKLQEM